MAHSPPKTDKRLLGTWKSDRRRTFSEWIFRRKPTPEKLRKLRAIFGKLQITYTRTRIRSLYHDDQQTRVYKVLGPDEESVAIGTKVVAKHIRIQHIHFDGPDRYWISLSGRNREWFRRVPKSPRAATRSKMT